MDIIKITSFALIAVIFAILLKTTRPEMAMLLEIAAGIVIIMFVIIKLSLIMDFIIKFTEKINLDKSFLLILIKAVGIAFIAEFGINFCKDANHSGIASKIEFAAKILILSLAMPVFFSLIDVLTKIMNYPR